MNKRLFLTIFLPIIIGLPSSLVAINDFTNLFEFSEDEESFWCIDGTREGWYKNCEYGFQFELDTQNWHIYDKNTQNARIQPFENEPDNYWLAFDLSVGETSLGMDAYGSIVIDELSSSYNFNEYVIDYKNSYNSTFTTTEILQWVQDEKKLETSYNTNYTDFNEIFICYDSVIFETPLVYLITTCEFIYSVHTYFISNQIATFWETFVFI